MKTVKISRYIALTAAVIVLAGCQGFFDNNAPSSVTPENVFSNPTLTEQSIAAVYEVFGEDRGYRNRLTCGYVGLNTDIEYNRKSSNEYAIYQTKTTNTDLSNAKGNDPWGYLNIIIERCNNIVDGIDKYGVKSDSLTAAKYDYMKGEALFLRSFALLEMVKYWGDVPVNVKSYDGYSLDEVTQGKVDRNVAFEQIRTDLKLAAELMEWSGNAQLPAARNDVRRASKASALALLARADLMYAGKAVRPTQLVAGNKDYEITFNVADADKRYELYQEVMWACDSIIRNEDSKLLDDYAQIFKNICQDKTNYAEMEHIWVLPLADGARGQVMNYNCAKFNSNSSTSAGDITMGVLLHNIKYGESVGSNFIMAMVPTLLFDYEDGDVRREVTVLPYKWNVTTSGTIDATLPRAQKSKMCLYPRIQQDASQWACGKYRIEWMSRDNVNADDGIDFPVIRYSDVLLMFAEASIGSLDNTTVTPLFPTLYTGQQCFDKVRERADVGTKTLTLEALQEERKLEFAGEYIRKWDLMRWGILKEALMNARERLDDLRENHEAHVLYFKYKEDNSYLQAGAKDYTGADVVRGYVIEEVYGMRLDETDTPTGDRWLSGKCKFMEKLVDTDYILYDYSDPESINSHQYWPIFSTIIGASNGILFNNYGY